ncbi:MAG: nucleotidyl transferase AbiEii/AbiGii toxin family protein [Cytophagales bacterium]|nr:nucleotidyl transferase AbiEii/AbiGii toxin family protein [Cytophagales bacterium]
MLYEKTVTSDILRVLEKISGIDELEKFQLVGGTALALQLGHRQSFDLDFFAERGFNKEYLELRLRALFPEKKDLSQSINGFSCKLDGVRCDFYDWKTGYIREPVDFKGIKIASTEDIAAFKLDAITRRTTIKDFWDIAELLDRYSIKEMIMFYKEKYPYQDIRIVMDSLPKVEKITEKPEYKIFKNCTLKDVNKKIETATKEYIANQIKQKKEKQEERVKKAEKLIERKQL